MLPMIWIGECVRVRRCALGKGFTHQRAKRIKTGDFVEQPAQLRLKGLAQNTLRARIGDVQTKLRSNTNTPALRFANTLSRYAFACSSAFRFRSTAARASDNCRVIALNDWVRKPSSSLLLISRFGV